MQGSVRESGKYSLTKTNEYEIIKNVSILSKLTNALWGGGGASLLIPELSCPPDFRLLTFN